MKKRMSIILVLLILLTLPFDVKAATEKPQINSINGEWMLQKLPDGVKFGDIGVFWMDTILFEDGQSYVGERRAIQVQRGPWKLSDESNDECMIIDMYDMAGNKVCCAHFWNNGTLSFSLDGIPLQGTFRKVSDEELQNKQVIPGVGKKKKPANDILDLAAYYADNAEYREAIRILDEAWAQDNYQECYDAAANYRKEFGKYNTSKLAAGEHGTIVVNADGTVTMVGRNNYGQVAGTKKWEDIVAVSMGDKHVVGLKADGTVVSSGSNESGRSFVRDWENVEAITAGDSHTVALLKDGSLIATGNNQQGQCDVEELSEAANGKRIVSIAAGWYHTVALLEDGTVVACGQKGNNACDVQEWKDIAAIYAGQLYTAGLKTDGTVVVTGQDATVGDWDLSQWKNRGLIEFPIDNLAAGDDFLVGIYHHYWDPADLTKCDVVVVGLRDDYSANTHLSMNSWKDIKYIAAGSNHTVAITGDGRILCAGANNYHQCDLHNTNFDEKGNVVQREDQSGKVKDIVFNYYYPISEDDVDAQYAVITGLNNTGKEIWTYKTDYYDAGAQLDLVSELGRYEDRYYFIEDGSVVALNAETGKVMWKNHEFGGNMPHKIIGEDGTLYLSGALGPTFFVVDKNGKTLCREETFEPEVWWIEVFAMKGNEIIIIWNGYTEAIRIDLHDFSYQSCEVDTVFDVKTQTLR